MMFFFYHLIIIMLDNVFIPKWFGVIDQVVPCQGKHRCGASGDKGLSPVSRRQEAGRAAVLARQNLLVVGGPLGGQWRSAICPLQSAKGYNSFSVGNSGRRICLNKIARLSECESHSQLFCALSKRMQNGNHLLSGQNAEKSFI